MKKEVAPYWIACLKGGRDELHCGMSKASKPDKLLMLDRGTYNA